MGIRVVLFLDKLAIFLKHLSEDTTGWIHSLFLLPNNIFLYRVEFFADVAFGAEMHQW